MNSPPSIYTQSSEAAALVDLEGPTHFESTEIGTTSIFRARAALPRSRTSSFVEGEELGAAHKRTLNAIRKATAVANEALIRAQNAQKSLRTKPTYTLPWPQDHSPSSPQDKKQLIEGEGRSQITYKRPTLSASELRASSGFGQSPTEPKGLKRPAEEQLPHQRRAKAPRLPRDDPGVREAFRRSSASPLDTSLHNPFSPPPGPVSPLFFSNNRHQRPPFAPRFSSSEAGAVLLRGVDMEDAPGGGPVKTVNMARASFGQMSPPALGGGSREGTPRMKLSSHRTTPSSREDTPDEREITSGGVQSLLQGGVLELLDQDDRASFVIDLSYRSNFSLGPLYVSHFSSSLRNYPGMMDQIRGRSSGDTPAFSPTPSFPEFKQWVTSFVRNGEAMDVCLPSFTYAGLVWKAFSMKKRFRVFQGTALHANFLLPVAGTPGTLVPGENGQSTFDEPGDYFGQAALSPVKEIRELESPEQPVQAPSIGPTETKPRQTEPTPLMEAESTALVRSDQEARPNSDNRVSPVRRKRSPDEQSPLGRRSNEAILGAATAGSVDWFGPPDRKQGSDPNRAPDSPSSTYYFDWTRLPMSNSLPRHVQFARNIDWAQTSLGPIESWSGHLRATSCLIMASPHPSAMYWGDDFVALYNEPYILLAGQKHPQLMGTPYAVAWAEIWDNVKDSFAQARLTGQSTMKDDDRLFINRSGFLEETYFSWSIIPLVGDDGTVVGLYNPAFEKTRRKIAERRMLTLREVGEKTAAAREVKGFWGQVLKALEYNEYDTPFVLLYSITDEDNSDGSSIHSNSILGAKQLTLEGSLPDLPPNHPAAPQTIDLKSSNEGFAHVFRDAMMNDKHVLLETANGTLDDTLLDNMAWRGFNEKPRAAVVSPIHPTTGDSIIGFLVMGVNPRRPYDDDYNLFVTLLTRQLATSMASVVLFEEEIRRGQQAAKLAALDRIELSEQLAARTQEAIESETKFTRMAEFAPVGIFIANKEGTITFTNSVFHSLTHLPKNVSGEKWMEVVRNEDKSLLESLWDDVVQRGVSRTEEIRFKGVWRGQGDATGDIWVLCSVFVEKYPDGTLKSIFGSLTDISQQKWAESVQIKRMEEAVELKRQQSNFIDMTSHEMRNPLSAVLQSADEIAGSLIEYKNSKDATQIPLSLIESNIDAAQTISLCANHQTRIVSDVLTLSKLDSALLLVTPVDVQPKVIVQQALKMFEGELLTADINLDFHIDKSLDELKIDWVRLDPSRLLQVLINLMTNAIKFTTPEPNRTIGISLTASREEPSKQKNAPVDYIPRLLRNKDATEGPDWGDGEQVFLHFAVQDTGKGLNDNEKKLLFLRFSQTNPRTHVQYGGSGLGLFISRELTELQGGEIGVSSESGKGSTFAFYVRARKSKGPPGGVEGDIARNLAANGTALHGPMRKPSVNYKTRPTIIKPSGDGRGSAHSANQTMASGEPAGTAAVANPPLPKTAKGTPPPSALSYLKVLIVEDNLVNQKVLAKQLRNIGCNVSVANHGEEALAHLRKTKFWTANAGKADALELSVILMDLEMPVMDGLTCTKRIRELEAGGELSGHSPIIAVSANARSAHVESAMEAGMDDVVSKPFRIPELVPKMELLVAKFRPSKEKELEAVEEVE